MIRLSADALRRWRAELDLGIEFRDREFGTYRRHAGGQPPQTTLAGRNLDYFEQGARSDEAVEPPLNVVFPIVKNIVPTLLFQHPRAVALPAGRRDQYAADDAFYVAELLNQDLRDVDFHFTATGQQAVFDAFVLGFGVVKQGYATEFGPDVLPTPVEEKKKLRDQLKDAAEQLLVSAGLKAPAPPPEPEPEHVEADALIRSERPYLVWLSPFEFVIDPRARDLSDARWVAQLIRRTLGEIKRDPRYGPAKHELVAEAVEDDRIPQTELEDFQTVDCWELHYKNPDSPTGITVLTLAATQQQTKALLHDHNAYDLGGWQFEWLPLNKHGHRLYPISTISVVRPLIDRINSSFDAILEQVDKFAAKLVYNDRVTPDGEVALDTPTIGARVKISGENSVRDAVAVISMEQVKADLVAFVQRVMDFVLLIVGLTQAQLTGLSTAQTATEAQIGQGGQNLRRSDEGNLVAAWATRVLTKHWRIKAQFQDLTEQDLVQETPLLDPGSGLPQSAWYPPIDAQRALRLKRRRFKIHIELGSIQKPNLEILRAQFEAFVRALMEPIVTQGLALEGKRLSASEIIRQWSQFFTESGLQGTLGKMIVPVSDPLMQNALLNYGQTPTQTGAAQLAGSVPNRADLISATAGEKGQGVPIA